MSLPIYGSASHKCHMGEEKMEMYIRFLKSHGLEVTHFSARTPLVRIHGPAWIQEELGCVTLGQSATLATTIHRRSG